MNVHSLSNQQQLTIRQLDAPRAEWPAHGVAKGASAAREWDAAVLRNFPPEQRYLIGVSGGRDSVALLHWLLGRGYRKLIVCHLDHRLRGRSATADARFVEKTAEAKQLSFELGQIEVRALAAQEKVSIESAARSARYSFFAEVARRRRCRTIFLGHHADDLVETFLINLFRGAGTHGQRSIREVVTRQIDRVELTIVRPLLSVSRAEIDDYIETHHLRFREDATNERVEPLRNRMRHRIIPMLEKEFGRDIRKTVRRAALIAADEDALLNEMLPMSATRPLVKTLRDLPVALQRRAIARWLREERVSEVSFDLVEQVRAMFDAATGPAKINLPGKRHARRRSRELFIEPSRVASASA